MIFGYGATKEEAEEKYHYIPDGGMNQVIKDWHSKQPKRVVTGATPSSILTCPRVVWLKNKEVEFTNEMTWAVSQRLMLGRELENLFAQQLKDEGKLYYHWDDRPGIEVYRFEMGEGLDRLDGVPDYILNLESVPTVSDAKTSRSDSFGYVPIEEPWTDWGWYKYRLQLTAYYMLCRANEWWFTEREIPLPEQCHLFSYALDDGVIRREYTWTPTTEDMDAVRKYVRRFNEAFASEGVPPCTCPESFDQFDVKFCPYGIKREGQKIADTCCSDELIP
jgi:hypothetical protein